MRNLLRFLAYFNWITPLEIITRRAVQGRCYSFKIPEGGLDGGQIVKMLREQGGISSFGYMVVNGHYMFHVPLVQAEFAQYLMARAGITVANPIPLGGRRARR